MMPVLLRLWRKFPLWVHILAARIVRPGFHVAVAAMVFDEQGRILLFKHTYRKFEWGIPAGGLEYDEQPEKAILREFFEETRMTIEVQRLLMAESSKVDHHVSLIYLCKIVEGEFRESLEISGMKYFPVHDLPPMLFTEKDLIRRVAGIVRDMEFGNTAVEIQVQ
jgi:ADP-ribose pyrophosphatase YjhB (NUDIX family)